MDRAKLQTLVTSEAETIWDAMCEIYPHLAKFNPPKIELNPYCWKTAGSCFQDQNRVSLSLKFFKYHFDTMIDVILPHEIAHQVDYNLFGESEKRCGHGKNWKMIMLAYGLPANPYHSMNIPRK